MHVRSEGCVEQFMFFPFILNRRVTMNAKLVVVAPLLLIFASAPLALAQTKSANPVDQKGPIATATPSARPDAKPIEDLQLAAQRLRDAIHAMLNEPAGAKRTELIEAGDRALAEVESAMANLPLELLTAEAAESAYKDSADRLQMATQNLHEATQALAKDPNSARRNDTLKKIRIALQETRRLMHQIPQVASTK
jgi:hypothetical protein